MESSSKILHLSNKKGLVYMSVSDRGNGEPIKTRIVTPVLRSGGYLSRTSAYLAECQEGF